MRSPCELCPPYHPVGQSSGLSRTTVLRTGSPPHPPPPYPLPKRSHPLGAAFPQHSPTPSFRGPPRGQVCFLPVASLDCRLLAHLLSCLRRNPAGFVDCWDSVRLVSEPGTFSESRFLARMFPRWPLFRKRGSLGGGVTRFGSETETQEGSTLMRTVRFWLWLSIFLLGVTTAPVSRS